MSPSEQSTDAQEAIRRAEIRREAEIADRQAKRRAAALALGRRLARIDGYALSAAVKIAAAADTARRHDVPFPHGAARDAVMVLLAETAKATDTLAIAAVDLAAAWAYAFAVEQDRLPGAERMIDFPFPDLEDAAERLLREHRIRAGEGP